MVAVYAGKSTFIFTEHRIDWMGFFDKKEKATVMRKTDGVNKIMWVRKIANPNPNLKPSDDYSWFEFGHLYYGRESVSRMSLHDGGHLSRVKL